MPAETGHGIWGSGLSDARAVGAQTKMVVDGRYMSACVRSEALLESPETTVDLDGEV